MAVGAVGAGDVLLSSPEAQEAVGVDLGPGKEGPWVPEGYAWMSPIIGQEKFSEIWGVPSIYEERAKVETPTEQPIQWARGLGAQARGEQYGALEMLRRRAAGEESVARMAGEREREASQRAIVSAMRSGRRTPASARAALMQTSEVSQEISGKIAEAEMQERLAAEKAYYAAATGMRQQDIAQQQAEQDWWRLKADWERIKKDIHAKYMSLGLQDKEAERKARVDLQTLIAQIHNKHLQHKSEMSAQQNAAIASTVSTGLAVAGATAALMFSDSRVKTNISPMIAPLSMSPTPAQAGQQMPMLAPVTSTSQPSLAAMREPTGIVPPTAAPIVAEKYRPQAMTKEEEVENMLDQIQAYNFEYMPGFGPPGPQVGVMAQDLEKSRLGSQMVVPSGMGDLKAVDYSPERFNPVVMASLANMNDRLRSVEADTGPRPDVNIQEPGSLRSAMLAGGTTLERPAPVAPQQGVLGGGTPMEERPDLSTMVEMLSQMGGRA